MAFDIVVENILGHVENYVKFQNSLLNMVQYVHSGVASSFIYPPAMLRAGWLVPKFESCMDGQQLFGAAVAPPLHVCMILLYGTRYYHTVRLLFTTKPTKHIN